MKTFRKCALVLLALVVLYGVGYWALILKEKTDALDDLLESAGEAVGYEFESSSPASDFAESLYAPVITVHEAYAAAAQKRMLTGRWVTENGAATLTFDGSNTVHLKTADLDLTGKRNPHAHYYRTFIITPKPSEELAGDAWADRHAIVCIIHEGSHPLRMSVTVRGKIIFDEGLVFKAFEQDGFLKQPAE